MKKLLMVLLVCGLEMVCFAKESYKHNQNIKFNNSGFGIGVYSKVYGLNEKPVVDFELQKGDTVKISECIFDSESEDSIGNLWMKVLISSEDGSNKKGYLCLRIKNPFKNWKNINKIDDKEIMSWNDFCDISYGYNLKEKPDHNSKTIKEIEKRVDDTKMYNVLALTKDKYPDEEGKNPSYWVLIDFNGIECWIHGSHCSKGIGGPTFMTPENRIYFELVYVNEI